MAHNHFATESEIRTPWAVHCQRPCSQGLIYMTQQEYARQMSRPYYRWECPRCGELGVWSDDNYEAFQEPSDAAQ